MNVMRRFTLRSLLKNKRRTAVTIIGVILSVAMITAVSALTASFTSLFQRDAIERGGNWHAKITQVKEKDVRGIMQSDAVDVYSFAKQIGYTKVPDKEEKFFFLQQFTQEGFSQMSVRLISGRLPQNSNEVAISRRILAADLGVKEGDTLSLESGARLGKDGFPLEDNMGFQIDADNLGNLITNETFVPGIAKTYKIVGVVEQTVFEHSWSAGYGVLGYLDLASLAKDETVDALLTFKEINSGINKNVTALAALVNKTDSDIQYNTELLRYYGVMGSDRQTRFVYGMMFTMIGVIVVASVCLIYNAFAISVAERARQLGLLSSVGATISQKRSSVYFESLLIAAIGIPLGIAAGLGGIAITLHFLRPLFSAVLYMESNTELLMHVPLWTIAVTVLFSLITIFLSVYIPARRASRITPMEAIRLTREVKLTSGAVKTSWLTRKIFGFEAEIALKNLKRSRKKYRTTVVSLVISLVLFLTASQYVSLIHGSASAMDEGGGYDILLYYPQVSDELRLAVNREISALTQADEIVYAGNLWGVANMPLNRLTSKAREVIQKDYGTLEDPFPFSLSFISLDPKNFEAYAKKVGVDPAQYTDAKHPMGILINNAVQRTEQEDGSQIRTAGQILSVQPGDMISADLSMYAQKIRRGGDQKDQGKEVDVTIGALTDIRPMGVSMSSFSYTTMVVSEPVLQAILDLSMQEDMKVQHTVFFTAKGDDLALEKKLNDIMKANNVLEYSLYNIHSEARAVNNRNLFLGVLIYGFITLITLVCIANIFNTVSTNMALRRKEFAMLRSVGMTPGGFRKMIRYESIFYGIKSLLYGLPLSIATAILMYVINRSVMDYAFTLPVENYLIGVFMILIIVITTMLYATSKSRKDNIIEALKEDNI